MGVDPMVFVVLLVLVGLPSVAIFVSVLVEKYRRRDDHLESIDNLESVGPRDKRMADWKHLADSTDLRRADDHPRPGIRLEGELTGIPTIVHRTTRSGTIEVSYEFDLEDRVPEGFSAIPRESPGPLQRWLDEPDIVSGNDELDRAYRFDGTHEREVKQCLWHDDVAELLLALDDVSGDARIEDETLKISRPGAVPSQHDGRSLIEWAIGWVHELEDSDESEPEAIDREAREGWVPPDADR